jgi:hypothetical protein
MEPENSWDIKTKEAQSWVDMGKGHVGSIWSGKEPIFRLTMGSSPRMYVPNSGLGNAANAILDNLAVWHKSSN